MILGAPGDSHDYDQVGHWTTCRDSQTLSPFESATDGTKPRGELAMKSGYKASGMHASYELSFPDT